MAKVYLFRMSVDVKAVGGHEDGEKLRRLLFESHGWVNRRVDAIRLGSSGTTRRHVSLDFTVKTQDAIHGSKDSLIIPIAVLQKSPLRGFDVTLNGKSLPVLGIADSGPLTKEMLMATVSNEIKLSASSLAELSRLISDAVRFQPLRSQDTETENLSDSDQDTSREGSPVADVTEGARFEAAVEADDAITDRMKVWLGNQASLSKADKNLLRSRLATIEQFIRNFVLLAEIDKDLLGKRSIVKYALDQDFPERRSVMWHEISSIQIIPDYGFARSRHIEFEVPSGLVVRYLELVPLDKKKHQDAGLVQDTRREQSRAAHVHGAPEDRSQGAVFLADVAPASQGLLTFSTWAVIVVFISAVLSIPLRLAEPSLIDTTKLVPSPAASLLLIGPALLLSWMAKEPEHRTSAMVLFPLRGMLLIDAFALVLMACLAAVPTVTWVWTSIWIAIYALVSVALCWLILYRWAWGGLVRWFSLLRVRAGR